MFHCDSFTLPSWILCLEGRQGIQSKAEVIKCYKETKITAPPNECCNILLCPAIRLNNLIESQTWWTNSRIDPFAKSWNNSKVNCNHEIPTKKRKRIFFSQSGFEPWSHGTLRQCATNELRWFWKVYSAYGAVSVNNSNLRVWQNTSSASRLVKTSPQTRNP